MHSTDGADAVRSILIDWVSGPPDAPGLQPSEVSFQAESTVASGGTGVST